jgi:uncharacterized protein with HEPN domain
MSKRAPELLLQDILASAEKIILYTSEGNYGDFLKDDRTMDAVIRNFEIIGEASNRLPEETKNELPEINWTKIRGFRNRIVHDYFGIDYEIVWDTKEELLPGLIAAIKNKLNIRD